MASWRRLHWSSASATAPPGGSCLSAVRTRSSFSSTSALLESFLLVIAIAGKNGEILARISSCLITGQMRKMGIRERQSREREAVRRAILNAARTLFLAEGYANVSMRKIADQIEYSPGAIYSYFASKEDIFFSLAEEGLQFLRHHCASP